MFLPIWVTVGILADVAMTVLQPASGVAWRVRTFGAVVPVVLWTAYYGFFVLTGYAGGVWLTGYIWSGSIVQAGIIGFWLAFLMTPGRECLEGK